MGGGGRKTKDVLNTGRSPRYAQVVLVVVEFLVWMTAMPETRDTQPEHALFLFFSSLWVRFVGAVTAVVRHPLSLSLSLAPFYKQRVSAGAQVCGHGTLDDHRILFRARLPEHLACVFPAHFVGLLGDHSHRDFHDSEVDDPNPSHALFLLVESHAQRSGLLRHAQRREEREERLTFALRQEEPDGVWTS